MVGGTAYELRVAAPSDRGRGLSSAVLDGAPIDCAQGLVRVPLDGAAHILQLVI
jgi:hypothetical protein